MKQRTPQWHSARYGRITASRFNCVIANQMSKRYQWYVRRLADQFMGIPSMEDQNPPWFNHGVAWEKEARHDRIIRVATSTGLNIRIQDVGLVVHPKYNFIAGSPDGKILGYPEGTGGHEIKCHKSYDAFEKSRHSMPMEYQPQVQGYLWITGWKFWDFTSYYKNVRTRIVKSFTHRILPNKEYHEMLERRCLAFWDDVHRMIAWRNV